MNGSAAASAARLPLLPASTQHLRWSGSEAPPRFHSVPSSAETIEPGWSQAAEERCFVQGSQGVQPAADGSKASCCPEVRFVWALGFATPGTESGPLESAAPARRPAV